LLFKYGNISNIVKYYEHFKSLFSILMYFKMSFIPVMQSWIFSIISVTWSFRNHSNIIFSV